MQVAAAARRFLLALLARQPAELAPLCGPSFSFDGRVEKGPDRIRARWAESLTGESGGDRLLDLAVAPAAEAQAKLGKPPRRIAPLLAPGTWVAVADVSGRAVVVTFARQGSAWLATGIQD